MRRLLSIILITIPVIALYAQESVSSIGQIIPDNGAREVFMEYDSFYNSKLYIKDGNPNYHIVNTLFAGDFQIKNDFSAKRPEKLSLKDYISFLEEHYSFGVQVKFNGLYIISEVKTSHERQIILGYNKEVFGHFDNKLIVSKTFQERLSILKNKKGEWRISNIELIVPPFISADIGASIFYPGFSAVKGSGMAEIIGYRQEDRISFSFGAGIEIDLTDQISLASGFNYTFYNTSFYASSIKQEEVLSVDKDAEEYYLLAEGSDISDDIELAYFSIPITFKYYFLTEKKISPFVGAGGEIFINSSAKSSMQGLSTQQGYYPQYHVLLYDIPELGFMTNYNFSRTEDIEVNKTFFAAEIFAGARFQLYKDKIYGMLRVFYKPGLSKMLESGDYMLSVNAQEYNSLIFANDNVGVNSFGLNVGLKFKIK